MMMMIMMMMMMMTTKRREVYSVMCHFSKSENIAHYKAKNKANFL